MREVFLFLTRSSASRRLSWFLFKAVVLISVLMQQNNNSSSKHFVEGVVLFGAENGYDVDGGKEAICWSTNAVKAPTIEEMNENLFRLEEDDDSGGDDNNNNMMMTMMNQCFPGTSFTINPVFLEDDEPIALYTGRPYTYHLNLENVSQISDEILVLNTEGGESITTYLRLMLCSAIRTGFCNPIVDMTDVEQLREPIDTDIMKSRNKTVAAGGYDPYSYNSSGFILKGMDVGSHIVTRWVKHNLMQLTPDNMNYTSPHYQTQLDLSIEIPLDTIEDGPYFLIGHAIATFNIANSAMIKRLDIANAIPNHLVDIMEPPEEYLTTRGLKIYLGVVIGIACIFQMYIIGFLWYNRNHTVVTLAQGHFLIWLVTCTLVSTVFSFTFLPTRDWFCRLHSPFVLIPLSMSGAILCGRLWRVYVTISPALKMGSSHSNDIASGSSSSKKLMDDDIDDVNKGPEQQQQKMSAFYHSFQWGNHLMSILTFMSQVPCCSTSMCNKGGKDNAAMLSRSKRNNRSFRQKVTAAQTVRLIIALCIPQMILQTYLYFHFSNARSGLSHGRSQNEYGIQCCIDDGHGMARDLGAVLCGLLFVLALVLAWLSRDLPSVFNEKNQIFQAATINSIVAFIVLSLEFIVRGTTVSPDMVVFLWSIMTLALTTTINFLIVFPKVRRVMSNEKVAMTSLISDKANKHGSMSKVLCSTSPASLKNITEGERKGDENEDLLKKKITLNKDDPLPRSVCISMLHLREVINGVNQNVNNGRTLTIKDWGQLINKMRHAQEQLDRIDISWTEADENQASSGGPQNFGLVS